MRIIYDKTIALKDDETCEWCGSLVNLLDADKHIGAFGAVYFTCPCCGHESIINDAEGIELTPQNLEYPKHFAKVNMANGYPAYDDFKITERIKGMIECLKMHSDIYTIYDHLGITLIVVATNASHDDFDVYVANNFYKTSFDLENKYEEYKEDESKFKHYEQFREGF